MKNLILFLVIFLTPILVYSEDPLLRVMTYNIRYDNSTIFSMDPNRWSKRRDPMADMIRSYDVDILGVQEAFSWQVDDLAHRLPDMAWWGMGRDDGSRKGEFAAIFFKKDKFTLLGLGNFWLSPTPDKVSKGWDAVDNRVATWVFLHHNASGKNIFVLNTHLEYLGKQAREESMKLIISRLESLSKKQPTIVTGDFNTQAISTMTRPYSKTDSNGVLRDSYYISLTRQEGPRGTFLEMGDFSTNNKPKGPLDYIFVNKKIDVISYKVLTDSKDGRYFSDHLPVLVEIQVH